MSQWRTRVVRITAAVLGTVAMTAGAADAIDVRSWDQKIVNVNQRFVILSAFDDEAVLDKETQLVWQRASTGVIFWTYGDATGSHESTCLQAATGGRKGWRIPSIHELNSLFVNGVLPAGHPFINIKTGLGEHYWSSTLKQDEPGVAYGVDFNGAGTNIVRLASGPARLWCVRGPGGDSSRY